MIEQRYPAGYAYEARFADLRAVGGGEGCVVYAGTDGGRPVLVTDESTAADLAGDDDLLARAVCVRTFASGGERARYFQTLMRHLTPLPDPAAGESGPSGGGVHLSKRGFVIRTPDDWLLFAPPKAPEAHWVAGRSALECAVAWCGGPEGPAVPAEIAALLDSHPDTRRCTLTAATPEHPIAFDELPGEPRNADVAAQGKDARGALALTVEAKADEPFDRRVADVLAEAVDRAAHGERTNIVRRVEQLAAALLPPARRGLPGLGELRYQLLTGAAGTLAYAATVGAGRAVLVVHEFVTPATRDERHRTNAADLDAFVRRLSGGDTGGIPPDRLAGPFRVPGGPLFARPAALYVGKVQRWLRAPGA